MRIFSWKRLVLDSIGSVLGAALFLTCTAGWEPTRTTGPSAVLSLEETPSAHAGVLRSLSSPTVTEGSLRAAREPGSPRADSTVPASTDDPRSEKRFESLTRHLSKSRTFDNLASGPDPKPTSPPAPEEWVAEPRSGEQTARPDRPFLSAKDDAYSTEEDRTLSVEDPENGVLANDTSQTRLTASVVTSPSKGDLTLNSDGTFEYDPAPDSTGTDQFLYEARDRPGDTDTATVEVAIEPANDPPTVSLTAPTEEALVQEGRQVRLRAEAEDPDGTIQEVRFRVDGTTVGRDQDASDGFETTWTPTTPGSVEVVAEAVDDRGAEARTQPLLVRVRATRISLSVQRSFSDPTQQRSFRLVALPGQANRSLASTLSDRSSDDWRAFREGGATGSQSYSRESCGDGGCTFQPGIGFWLIARGTWAVEDSIDTVPLQAGSGEAVHRMALHDGWNIVSNPLEDGVSWEAVQTASGTNQALWRWTGSWERARTFSSATEGEAYYFRDDALDSLVVPFGASGSDGARSSDRSLAAQPPKDASSASSRLSLSVVEGEDTVSTVVAGMQPGAEEGIDGTDRYAPPGYFGGVALRLLETEDDGRSVLATEYKPAGPDGVAYDVRLQAPPDTAITLVARGGDSFSQARISLVRRPMGREHDLRADSTLTIVPNEETTRFRLLIGSDAFVKEGTRDITPPETELLPNYPNPFRQATTLEYALPERQQVRIEIYDALGRRVRVLVDKVQGPGFHQVRWAGRADGRPVANGVYFARLNTETATKIERLVVLR